MRNAKIPAPTIRRLPVYLEYLKKLPTDHGMYITAADIARAFGQKEAQVRKDLSTVCTSGRPRVGYAVNELIVDIEDFLGYNRLKNAVIVGVSGKGSVLFDYDMLLDYGLKIVAVFESDPGYIGTKSNGILIRPLSDIQEYCKSVNVQIGILTVPAEKAQEAFDKLKSAGVKAVWNYSQTYIKPEEGVYVLNQSIALSVALLHYNISKQS